MINSENAVYLIPYFISLGISLGVAVYALRHRAVAGATSYAVVALSQAIIILGYIFELVNTTLAGKIFWDSFQWFGTVTMPVAFFAFALDYTGQLRSPAKRIVLLLLIIPTIFLLLVATNSRHGLILTDPQLIEGYPFSALVYDFTTAVWLIAFYLYGLVIYSIFLLLRHCLHSQPIYRRQTSTIIFGMLVPVVGSMLTVGGITLTFQRDIAPLTLAIGNLIVIWGLYRFRLFDLVPVAKETVVENMPDVVFVLDPQNRVVDINSIAAQLLAQDKAGMIGQPAGVVFSQWPHLVETFQDVQNVQTEITIHEGRNIKSYDFRLTSLKDRQGQFVGRVIIGRDVSELKQAEKVQSVLLDISQTATSATSLEELLTHIQQQLGNLIDTTNFYVALYDETTGYYSFPYWTDEQDRKSEEWQPQPLPKSYTDYVRRTGQPLLADWTTHQQLTEQGEVELIDAPSELWLGAPLRSPDGIIGVIVVQSYYDPNLYSEKDLDLITFASDTIALAIERKRREETLTKYRNHLEDLVEKRTAQLAETNEILRREIIERKVAEEILQSYTKKLERSNRELRDFTHITSHDLQEPLRKIQTFSDRLQHKYESLIDEQGRYYLERMRNAALHSQNLIKDLYVYSQISSQGAVRKEINLAKMIDAILTAFKNQIEQTKATIIVHELPCIEADFTQTHHLFQELLSNALKFHREGVPPQIEIREVNGEDISAGFCRIAVADNGMGFEEKYLDRIFNLFQRLHPGEDYDGTGIGLAICRRIVEQHNGRIWASSTPEQGTTFYIELPLKKSGNTTTEDKNATGPGAAS